MYPEKEDKEKNNDSQTYLGKIYTIGDLRRALKCFSDECHILHINKSEAIELYFYLEKGYGRIKIF